MIALAVLVASVALLVAAVRADWRAYLKRTRSDALPRPAQHVLTSDTGPGPVARLARVAALHVTRCGEP